MSDFSFEHEQGFAQGELAGHVQLGKFQAHYEELFAEVIEDGVITPDERARLNRAADALGLDRMALRRLEEALQAAYEARHNVRVREVADEEAPPASIVLTPEMAKMPRLSALELRIAELEAQVADLTRQLEQAREQVAVEVDLSTMPSPATGEKTSTSCSAACGATRATPRRCTRSTAPTARATTPIGAGSWRTRWCSSAPPTRASTRRTRAVASTGSSSRRAPSQPKGGSSSFTRTKRS
jgi:hypothetical protein